MLYPQNDDRIIAIDSVTSLHLMYATISSTLLYHPMRGQGHVTHVYILGTCLPISLERMKLDVSNLVCRLNVNSTAAVLFTFKLQT